MALNRDGNSKTVPAFPVHEETFVGTAAGYDCSQKVVRVAEDGIDVTFTLASGATVAFLSVPLGTDFSAEKGTTVTSTGTVWIG